MKTTTLLKRTGIRANEPVLLITAEEAIENILEVIENYCPLCKTNRRNYCNKQRKGFFKDKGVCGF